MTELESHAGKETGAKMLAKAKKNIQYITTVLVPAWKDGACSSGNQIEDNLKVCLEAAWLHKEEARLEDKKKRHEDSKKEGPFTETPAPYDVKWNCPNFLSFRQQIL